MKYITVSWMYHQKLSKSPGKRYSPKNEKEFLKKCDERGALFKRGNKKRVEGIARYDLHLSNLMFHDLVKKKLLYMFRIKQINTVDSFENVQIDGHGEVLVIHGL